MRSLFQKTNLLASLGRFKAHKKMKNQLSRLFTQSFIFTRKPIAQQWQLQFNFSFVSYNLKWRGH